MSTKHTPGPWHLATGTCGSPHMISWEPRKTYGHIATIPTPSFQELPEAKSAGEVLANAQLISAAPELLEALEEVTTELGWMGNGPRDSDREAFARRVKELRGLSLTAIAKAEGTPS